MMGERKTKSAIQSSAGKQTDSIRSVVAKLIGDLLGPAVAEGGLGLGDVFKDIRARNLERIAKIWEEKISKKSISVAAYNALPSGVIIKSIQDASLEDDHALQDMWANLFCMESVKRADLQIFSDILSRISPIEAHCLQFQRLRIECGDVDFSSLMSGPHADYLRHNLEKFSTRERYLAVTNLMRQQCLIRIIPKYDLDRADSRSDSSDWSGRDIDEVEQQYAVRRLFEHLYGDFDWGDFGFSKNESVIKPDPNINPCPELGFSLSPLGLSFVEACCKK